MNKYVKLTWAFLFLSAAVYSQPEGVSYFHVNNFQLTSPGTLKYGLYGYDNPALLSYADGLDIQFMWTDHRSKSPVPNDWGLFMGSKGFGFNVLHSARNSFSVTDYKVSLGGGPRFLSFGMGYGWSAGDAKIFNRQNYLSAGALARPFKYISLGFTIAKSVESDLRETYMDLAVRPLGNELLTLFGDYISNNNRVPRIRKDLWSAGAAIEIIDGLRLTGRYFETGNFTTGIQLGLGNLGASAQTHFDKNERYAYSTYGIRIGSYDRNLLTGIFRRPYYEKIDLNGQLGYRRFIFFDKTNTLKSLISKIDVAKDDKNISGLAINTSGMKAPRELLWEIRKKLMEFRATGRKVVIFIDNPSMDTYHFATAADLIVMDPIGMITMQGYIAGRTYYKGTLEKLGIGFDEWRFFRYKSALESFGRDSMSAGDREQRQALIDGFYNTARAEISSSRNIPPETFDETVDQSAVLLAEEALAKGLVDTLGRWPDAEGIIRKFEKSKRFVAGTGGIERLRLPDDNHWGEFDHIAVIYALGECDMDQGITARKLVEDVKAAAKNSLVKAIVLRVDSPGGDAMASDYIAEAVKEAKKRKPVIISQGSVAASGGYWLSMYGDEILAAPNTITGSIGVIAGWAYNKGFKEKMGFSTAYVKRGEHADLGFGATIPLLGIQLPDRNVTEQEFSKLKSSILSMYQGFVNRVASGRNLSSTYVDSIGQGRVWTGQDGLKLGLVDRIGGMDDAIKLAKEMAGIPKDAVIKIIEYPKAPLFNFGNLMPKLFGFQVKSTSPFNDFLFRLKHNGSPLPMLPLEMYESNSSN